MTTTHPKRRTFYSFHFDNDAWRAGQVRNIRATEHDEPVSDNSWEQVKRGGDAAIQRWINDQMSTRSCVHSLNRFPDGEPEVGRLRDQKSLG